jgi:AraC-like DNA-binding protein
VQYCSCTPICPLAAFVERLWHLNDAPFHAKELIMPSGTIELVVNLRENILRIYDPAAPDSYRQFSGAVVSGTYRRPFVTDTKQHASIVGVHFRPGGAWPFFGVDADDLADLHVNLETLWGAGAAELREKLCAAAGAAERFRLLEKALLDHFPTSSEHHPAVKHALSVFSQPETRPLVGEVARETGYSQRRFIQLFSREVGVSPKQFCRLQRFQRTLAAVRRTTAFNGARLAAEYGYFDQAHLIHEFRAFSNLSPTEYLKQRNEQVMESHAVLAG